MLSVTNIMTEVHLQFLLRLTKEVVVLCHLDVPSSNMLSVENIMKEGYL